ncbi:GyrI-like domain-containing protein, partial [Lysinibacillus sp. GbtcB16]|uniref:GyrI-like domain-containing protein n=1 Tax=Lysinibacillus sp. GbtcB16 TaxID=2824761 RepID=UPI001C30AA1A
RISTETSSANERTAQANIPQIWHIFYEQNIVDQLSKLDNQSVYGVYSDYETDVNGNYSITLGVEASLYTAPSDLVIKTIPAAKY